MTVDKKLLAKNYFEFENSVNTNFRRDDIHYHNSYEIYYLTEGVCWYFIDKKSYHLESGDIAFIPKGVIHKTNYETEFHSRLLINCSENFIPDSVKDHFSHFPHFKTSEKNLQQIDEIFNTIQKEYHEPDDFSEDIIRNKVSELLLLVARQSQSDNPPKSESPIIEKAVAYIRKHYAGGVTLNGTAAYCYVSPEHLSRTFKKETGFGFHEYLTIYRLKKAHALLVNNPEMKIADIAPRCGFSDSNYFSKVYKKMYKTPPTKTKRAVAGEKTSIKNDGYGKEK